MILYYFIRRQAQQLSVSPDWSWRHLFENQVLIRVRHSQHNHYGLHNFASNIFWLIFQPYTVNWKYLLSSFHLFLSVSKLWTRCTIWYHLRQSDNWSKKSVRKKSHWLESVWGWRNMTNKMKNAQLSASIHFRVTVIFIRMDPKHHSRQITESLRGRKKVCLHHTNVNKLWKDLGEKQKFNIRKITEQLSKLQCERNLKGY